MSLASSRGYSLFAGPRQRGVVTPSAIFHNDGRITRLLQESRSYASSKTRWPSANSFISLDHHARDYSGKGSGRQHRDYAEEIQVILLQSQAVDIGHHKSCRVSITLCVNYSERHWLATILLGWPVDEVCFGLTLNYVFQVTVFSSNMSRRIE